MVDRKRFLIFGCLVLFGIFGILISLSFAGAAATDSVNLSTHAVSGNNLISGQNFTIANWTGRPESANASAVFWNVTFLTLQTGAGHIFWLNNTGGSAQLNATVYFNLTSGFTVVGNSSNCSIMGGAAVNRTACWGWLVLNGTSDLYNISDGTYFAYVNVTNASSYNISTGVTANTSFNITIDNKPPQVSLSAWIAPVGVGKNFSGNLILNISVNDSGMGVNVVRFNISNGTSGVQNVTYVGTFEGSDKTGHNRYSVTISTGELKDGLYNITVWANDTFNQTNNTLVFSWGIKFDNTAPSGTVTCTPSTVQAGATVTCTCAKTDETSGANSSAITTTLSTSNTGKHPVSCTVIDTAGNSGTASGSYNVELSGGGGGSSGGGGGSSAGTTTPEATITKEFTTIEAGGSATVSTGLGVTYGLKSISIEVSNAAQNVKVTVNKYDGVPAAVSVEKVGKVYRYLQINANNIQGNLKKGVIKAQVLKSWVASNELDKDKIAMYKFVDGAWKELTTTFKEDDGNNYIYDVEVDSFSYFAIGERIEQVVAAEEPAAEKGSRTIWVGVIAAIVIVAGLVYWIVRKKK